MNSTYIDSSLQPTNNKRPAEPKQGKRTMPLREDGVKNRISTRKPKSTVRTPGLTPSVPEENCDLDRSPDVGNNLSYIDEQDAQENENDAKGHSFTGREDNGPQHITLSPDTQNNNDDTQMHISINDILLVDYEKGAIGTAQAKGGVPGVQQSGLNPLIMNKGRTLRKLSNQTEECNDDIKSYGDIDEDYYDEGADINCLNANDFLPSGIRVDALEGTIIIREGIFQDLMDKGRQTPEIHLLRIQQSNGSDANLRMFTPTENSYMSRKITTKINSEQIADVAVSMNRNLAVDRSLLRQSEKFGQSWNKTGPLLGSYSQFLDHQNVILGSNNQTQINQFLVLESGGQQIADQASKRFSEDIVHPSNSKASIKQQFLIQQQQSTGSVAAKSIKQKAPVTTDLTQSVEQPLLKERNIQSDPDAKLNSQPMDKIIFFQEGELESIDVAKGAAGHGRGFEGFETPTSNREIPLVNNNEDPEQNQLSNRDHNASLLQVNITNLNGEGSEEGKKSVGELPGLHDPKSLYLFPVDSFFRVNLIKMVESKVFEYVIIVVILLNSVTMALYNYKDRDSLGKMNKIIDQMNLVFTGIFIGEAVSKILASGFVMHQQSYLRNGWNLIDSVVVISGILELTFGSVKLKALRVVRVFRPLKSINVIPSMKKLIQALIMSLPDFANVGIFLVYVFILFATMGLHQYNGAFYNICRYESKPNNTEIWDYDPSIMRVCSQSGLGSYTCPSGMYCGNNDQFPDIPFASDNINRRYYASYGIINFDNLGTSLLSVFQIITSDSWYQQLINMMDSDIPFFGALYCIMMIVVGQFFLMNLILAVIIFSFIKTQKKELANEIKGLNDGDIKIAEAESPDHQQKSQNNMSMVEPSRENDTFTSNVRSKFANSILENNPDGGGATGKSANNRSMKLKELQDEERRESENLASFLRPQAQKRKVANLFMMKKEIPDANTSRTDDFSITAKPPGGSLSFEDEQRLSGLKMNKEDSKTNETPFSQMKRGSVRLLRGSGMLDQQQTPPSSLLIRQEDPAFHRSLSKVKKPPVLQQQSETSSEYQMQNTLPLTLQQLDIGSESQSNFKFNLMNAGPSGSLPPGVPMHLFSKSFGDQGASKTADDSPSSTNQVARIFKRYIKKKIEQEYEIYFKKLLKEAQDNYKSNKNEAYTNKGNMREIVGIKVGLEFIRQHQLNQVIEEQQNQIEKRSMQNLIFKSAYNISESALFNGFMAISIILNTLVLALDKYPVNIQQTKILEKVNIVFTIIFTVEMVIKMVAIGVKNYFRGGAFNIFDSAIVIASISDILMSNFILTGEDNTSGSAITALRGFRLLRIFKLAKSWKKFELLLETLGRTLVDIATFSILLFLFIFTFSLLGLELFSNRAKFNFDEDKVDLENGESPKFNFDNFPNAFTTVFVVLTNDSTFTIYSDHYRAVDPAAATMFFVLLVIIGQKILLNLFLAILLENFDESALKHRMHEYELSQQQKENNHSLRKTMTNRVGNQIKQWVAKFKRFINKGNEMEEEISEEEKSKILKNLKLMGIGKNASKSSASILANQFLDGPEMEGKSLKLFTVNSKFRQFIFRVVTHSKFDIFIIFFIVLSAVQLAYDSPLTDPESGLKKSLFWIDLGTTIVFIMEAILKNIAFGFIVNGRSSYLRQSWNILDFIIITFSILSLTPLSDNLKSIKIFRILRLLRLISRNEELKVAVRALFLAIPNVANVTIIMLLFFLIFGVIAVSYFKGKLFYCINERDDMTHSVVHKWDCLGSGGDWINRVYNFDNIIIALITLFVLATTAGWSDVMMQCATSTNIDYVAGKLEDASPVWIFFFLLFIIVGAFFFLNLFVGVVISTFNSEHDKLGGNDLLTEKQKEWIDLRLLVLRSAPQRKLQKPEGKIRKIFFKIQTNVIFDRIILFSIIVNTIVLMFKWYEQPPVIDKIAEVLNYMFTAVFIIEAVVKLIAVEPRVYFSEGWNIFDSVIILGSFLSIFISANTSLEIRGAITILRSFRILRLLRLIKRGKSLQLIFNTFVITLHSLANIGGLLLLFIFMYSIMGMIVFGSVKRNGLMNDSINFENFFNAFLTLFIVATGDSWNLIMGAFTIENSPSTSCINNPTYDDYLKNDEHTLGCGSSTFAFAYFVSYMFVVNLVFLKIFIAIILQGYNDTQTQDSRLFNHDMNDKFRDIWTEFDPGATTFIKLSNLRDFLFALGEPLGFDESFNDKKFLQDQFIASLELPTYHSFTSYQYLDVLDALSFRLMVLDHIQKNYQMRGDNSMLLNSNSNNNTGGMMTGGGMMNMNKEQEREIKESLQKEINKLIFQKHSENITAVKEVSEKEMRRIRHKEKNKDKCGLTSSHHMAAEATVRKMKRFLVKKNLGPEDEIEDQGIKEVHSDDESSGGGRRNRNQRAMSSCSQNLQPATSHFLQEIGPVTNAASIEIELSPMIQSSSRGLMIPDPTSFGGNPIVEERKTFEQSAESNIIRGLLGQPQTFNTQLLDVNQSSIRAKTLKKPGNILSSNTLMPIQNKKGSQMTVDQSGSLKINHAATARFNKQNSNASGRISRQNSKLSNRSKKPDFVEIVQMSFQNAQESARSSIRSEDGVNFEDEINHLVMLSNRGPKKKQ